MSCVACHMSPVTSHQHQQPQPQTLPLLTPPLCTVGWFAKTEPNYFLFFFIKKKQIITTLQKKMVWSFEICSICSLTRNLQPSWLRSATYGTDKQTDRWTLQFIDWAGLGADAVKTLDDFRLFFTLVRQVRDINQKSWGPQLSLNLKRHFMIKYSVKFEQDIHFKEIRGRLFRRSYVPPWLNFCLSLFCGLNIELTDKEFWFFKNCHTQEKLVTIYK